VVRHLVWSPDGTRVAWAAVDGSVRVWDVDTGDTCVLGRHRTVVRDIDFLSDGQLVSVDDDGVMIRWRAEAVRWIPADRAGLRAWLADRTAAEVGTTGDLVLP
jgi:eukaryotic-like serine/threonine-protein kinase